MKIRLPGSTSRGRTLTELEKLRTEIEALGELFKTQTNSLIEQMQSFQKRIEILEAKTSPARNVLPSSDDE